MTRAGMNAKIFLSLDGTVKYISLATEWRFFKITPSDLFCVQEVKRFLELEVDQSWPFSIDFD
jgi:hypothetical protein